MTAAAWLAPVARALDDAGPCPVFFRDDDAGWADEQLDLLLDVFERHRVPVDVAVIPAELSPPLARALLARAGRADGAGVRLHQHGFAHVDHETGGRRCEFGPARPQAAVAADVVAGRCRLLDVLGDHLDPVFTPPWNRCTDRTADALVTAGIRVLSRDLSAGTVDRAGLAEVPVTVDWCGGRKGVRWTPAELAAQLAGSVRAGVLGVMLHHAVCDDAGRAAIGELLALVADHPGAVPTTILALAGGAPAPGART